MRSPRRGRTEHVQTAEDDAARAAAAVEASAVRMDRLSALRTAGLITEEDFIVRCEDELDRSGDPGLR